MYDCNQCSESFATFQAKANHVRWHHKEEKYTAAGLERVRAHQRSLVADIYGPVLATITEERTCHCGTKFLVTYRVGRHDYVKKCCSRSCGAKRKFTSETNLARQKTMKRLAVERPEFWQKGLQAVQVRSSSKAERALAEALRPHGFKRHKHATIAGKVIDVDIVSGDERVWVESDGEWHFRQVHPAHDFAAVQARDRAEEQEALERDILLLRVNNQTTTIEEQVAFVLESIRSWNGLGKVRWLGYDRDECQ